MPIFIKCIFILWVITFVMNIFARIWSKDVSNYGKILTHNYPKWIVLEGFLFIASIVSVIPLFIWLIFFK